MVVRFALKINPETAEVSVDGQGLDPIPHIVDGIPIHLRDIRAYVDRPNSTPQPDLLRPDLDGLHGPGSGPELRLHQPTTTRSRSPRPSRRTIAPPWASRPN